MKVLSYLKKAALVSAVAGIVAVLTLMPADCAGGVKKGLEYSCRIIIPSLFPYMALSSFIIRSGAMDDISELLSPVTKALFNLPGCCTPCILLSMAGGFPVGAKCTAVLYEKGKISSSQAQRLMCFCVCPGPAFLITGVGAVMLGNTAAGAVIYLAQVISCFIVGIAAGLFARLFRKGKEIEAPSAEKAPQKSLISNIVLSVSDGAYSIIGMTAMIVIFTMAETVIRSSGIYDMAAQLLISVGADGRFASFLMPAFMEVTGGCQAVIDNSLPLWCFSLCTGFGGLCVHMQIFDILGKLPFRRGQFMLFRLISAILSAAMTYIICMVFRPALMVFAAGGGAEGQISSVSIAGSIALTVMSALFVLSMHKADGKLKT